MNVYEKTYRQIPWQLFAFDGAENFLNGCPELDEAVQSFVQICEPSKQLQRESGQIDLGLFAELLLAYISHQIRFTD